MASFPTLPTELTFSIIEHLIVPEEARNGDESPTPSANESLLRLSTVSRSFREIVAPFLFSTLILRNTTKSANSISLIANGPYAKLVNRLEYLGIIRKPSIHIHLDGTIEPDYGSIPEDFPDAVDDVLGHLDRFPNLSGVGFEFPFDKNGNTIGYFRRGVQETEEQVVEAEKFVGWRVLMHLSYSALSRNTPGVVKSLHLRNLLAQECGVWRTKTWNTFSSEIQILEIGLTGGANSGWCESGFASYTTFMSNLDVYFLKPSTSLMHLSIYAAGEGPIMHPTIPDIAPLFSTPLSTRHLQSLDLDQISISGTLVHFLTLHASTLQSIRLAHAFCLTRPARGIQSWTHFFKTLTSEASKFTALRTFHVHCYASMSEADRNRFLPADRIVLMYAYVDKCYGDICYTEFQRGRERQVREVDWAAYDEFLHAVGLDGESRGANTRIG